MFLLLKINTKNYYDLCSPVLTLIKTSTVARRRDTSLNVFTSEIPSNFTGILLLSYSGNFNEVKVNSNSATVTLLNRATHYGGSQGMGFQCNQVIYFISGTDVDSLSVTVNWNPGEGWNEWGCSVFLYEI